MLNVDAKTEEANLRFDYFVDQQQREHEKNRIQLANAHKIGYGVISSSYHDAILELEFDYLRRLLDQRIAIVSEVFFNDKPRTDRDADFFLNDLERIHEIRSAVSRKSLIFWLKVPEHSRVLKEYDRGATSIYASMKNKIRIAILFNRRKYPELPDRTISELLADDEGQHLEFKSTFQWDIKKQTKNPDLKLEVVQAIAAFNNTDGGHVVIGIGDDKNIHGLEDDYELVHKRQDGFGILVAQELENRIKKGFASKLKFDYPKVDDKEVCIIKVTIGDEAAWVKDDSEEAFYIRDQKRTITLKQRDASDYILKKWGA